MSLGCKSGRSLPMSLFTTRNEHAALSFKQLMGRGDSEETGSGGNRGRRGRFAPRKTNLINTQHKDKMGKVLNFKVQQVAVDLVVDVRIILLLAQV